MASDTNIYHFEFDSEFWKKAEKIVLRIIVLGVAIQCDTLNSLINTV
tara:strand:+ start:43 stop:183 length:141 start_codon:yes stop_codon:yes gene_type:complete